MSIDTEIPADEPTIIMTRIYDAPRDLVWAVSTEPRHIRKWWGGPGVTNPVCEIDLRPGGRWVHAMRFPDGHELRLEFEFVEVEPPLRLVWRQHGDGAERPNVLFTTSLEALSEARTLSKLVVRFDSHAARDAAIGMGFTAPIEASHHRLVEYLKSL